MAFHRLAGQLDQVEAAVNGCHHSEQPGCFIVRTVLLLGSSEPCALALLHDLTPPLSLRGRGHPFQPVVRQVIPVAARIPPRLLLPRLSRFRRSDEPLLLRTHIPFRLGVGSIMCPDRFRTQRRRTKYGSNPRLYESAVVVVVLIIIGIRVDVFLSVAVVLPGLNGFVELDRITEVGFSEGRLSAVGCQVFLRRSRLPS